MCENLEIKAKYQFDCRFEKVRFQGLSDKILIDCNESSGIEGVRERERERERDDVEGKDERVVGLKWRIKEKETKWPNQTGSGRNELSWNQ
jgi:hypothetical protein